MCPKCGSRDMALTPGGELVCRRCGHRQPLPQADVAWIEAEIRRARLFERYLEGGPSTCDELVAALSREADQAEARLVARRILLHRLASRVLNQAEAARLAAEAERCR